MINPAALLPGAIPNLPGAASVLPNLSPGASSFSPATTPVGVQADREEGVSFDTPVQVATLQSAHKVSFWFLDYYCCCPNVLLVSFPFLGFLMWYECKSSVTQTRAKVSVQRRPQSRAARQQAAQRSVVDEEDNLGIDVPGSNSNLSGLVLPSPDKSSQVHSSPTPPNSAASTALPSASPSHSSPSEAAPRPFVLTLPASPNAGKKDSSKDSSSTKVLPSSDEDYLFASDSLFGATSVSDTPSTKQTIKTTQPQASSDVGLKKDKDKSTLPSIFDDNTDDLFQKVKPRSTKKVKASSFLEEEDDNEDIFGVSNSSTPTFTTSKETKNSSSFSKQDIFQVFFI